MKKMIEISLLPELAWDQGWSAAPDQSGNAFLQRHEQSILGTHTCRKIWAIVEIFNGKAIGHGCRWTGCPTAPSSTRWLSFISLCKKSSLWGWKPTRMPMRPGRLGRRDAELHVMFAHLHILHHGCTSAHAATTLRPLGMRLLWKEKSVNTWDWGRASCSLERLECRFFLPTPGEGRGVSPLARAMSLSPGQCVYSCSFLVSSS